MACVCALQNVFWSYRFFEQLNITMNSEGPIIPHYDSQATIQYIKDPKYHRRTNLTDIMYNSVRDIVVSGE